MGIMLLRIKKIILFGAFIATPLLAKEIQPPKLIISLHNNDVGLFSGLFAVLNSIDWCEKSGYQPVVFWDARSPYYVENGYKGSSDVWEYYFEPISSGHREQGDRVIESYSGPSNVDYLIAPLPFIQCTPVVDKPYRSRVNALINKYIRVKPYILEKVKNYHAKYLFRKKTIGIHLRGTDKYKEIGDPVELSVIWNYANGLVKQHPNCQFFVATDEQRLLDEAKISLKAPVLCYDSYRSLDGEPMHLYADKRYSKAKMGEEVLIEALLLSQCDKFIHTCSNVSCAVIFFNPELDYKLFLNEKVIRTHKNNEQ